MRTRACPRTGRLNLKKPENTKIQNPRGAKNPGGLKFGRKWNFLDTHFCFKKTFPGRGHMVAFCLIHLCWKLRRGAMFSPSWKISVSNFGRFLGKSSLLHLSSALPLCEEKRGIHIWTKFKKIQEGLHSRGTLYFGGNLGIQRAKLNVWKTCTSGSS